MTKSELVKRLDEIKQQISNDFFCSSDKVDDLFFALRYDITNDYDDIKDDARGEYH